VYTAEPSHANAPKDSSRRNNAIRSDIILFAVIALASLQCDWRRKHRKRRKKIKPEKPAKTYYTKDSMRSGLLLLPLLVALLAIGVSCQLPQRNLLRVPSKFCNTYRYLPAFSTETVFQLDRIVLTFERPLPEDPTSTDEAIVVSVDEMLAIVEETIVEEFADSVLVWEGEPTNVPRRIVPPGTRPLRVPFIPTVEMMSKFLFDRICAGSYGIGVLLVKLEVVNVGGFAGIVKSEGCPI